MILMKTCTSKVSFSIWSFLVISGRLPVQQKLNSKISWCTVFFLPLSLSLSLKSKTFMVLCITMMGERLQHINMSTGLLITDCACIENIHIYYDNAIASSLRDTDNFLWSILCNAKSLKISGLKYVRYLYIT